MGFLEEGLKKEFEIASLAAINADLLNNKGIFEERFINVLMLLQSLIKCLNGFDDFVQASFVGVEVILILIVGIFAGIIDGASEREKLETALDGAVKYDRQVNQHLMQMTKEVASITDKLKNGEGWKFKKDNLLYERYKGQTFQMVEV